MAASCSYWQRLPTVLLRAVGAKALLAGALSEWAVTASCCKVCRLAPRGPWCWLTSLPSTVCDGVECTLPHCDQSPHYCTLDLEEDVSRHIRMRLSWWLYSILLRYSSIWGFGMHAPSVLLCCVYSTTVSVTECPITVPWNWKRSRGSWTY